MTSPRRRHRRLAAACSALALGSVLAVPATAWGSAPEDTETGSAHHGDPDPDTAPEGHPHGPDGSAGDGHSASGGDGAASPDHVDGPAVPPEHDDDSGGPPARDDEPGERQERQEGQRPGGGPTDERAGAEEVDAATAAGPAEAGAVGAPGGEGERGGGSVTAGTEACEPMVTHTPDGSTGHRHAVAITSQAIERGVPGWTHVGWEAAEGTTVDEVHVVREDGTERRVGGDLRNGYAEDVLELRFCGDPAPAGDHGPGSRGDGARGQLPPDDGSTRSRPDDGARDASGQADGTEVEVLGRKLTADDAAGGDAEVLGSTLARTGAELEVLTGLGATGIVLGLAALAGARRLRRRAT
jgi:hypothetical protein